MNNNNVPGADNEELYVEETVFPSDERTVMPIHTEDEYGGAHAYMIRKFVAFVDGEPIYASGPNLINYELIHFTQKTEKGTVPGIQNEQLIIALKDRIKKLDARFPHPENKNMIAALDEFLAASKRRVQERMDRGVMGELKQ